MVDILLIISIIISGFLFLCFSREYDVRVEAQRNVFILEREVKLLYKLIGVAGGDIS
jgi:hypothetical protein